MLKWALVPNCKYFYIIHITWQVLVAYNFKFLTPEIQPLNHLTCTFMSTYVLSDHNKYLALQKFGLFYFRHSASAQYQKSKQYLYLIFGIRFKLSSFKNWYMHCFEWFKRTDRYENKHDPTLKFYYPNKVVTVTPHTYLIWKINYTIVLFYILSTEQIYYLP